MTQRTFESGMKTISRLHLSHYWNAIPANYLSLSEGTLLLRCKIFPRLFFDGMFLLVWRILETTCGSWIGVPLLGYRLSREHGVTHSRSNGPQDRRVPLYHHRPTGPILPPHCPMSEAWARSGRFGFWERWEDHDNEPKNGRRVKKRAIMSIFNDFTQF